MTLYHTSTLEIQKPDIKHSRPRLDFGKGFYLTELRSQAVRYGERFRRWGDVPIMNKYELDDIRPGFSSKAFNEYDGDWLDFITACRKGLPHEQYDIIAGCVADDNVFDTVDLYFSGVYSREQTLAELRFKSPNHQICISNHEVINQHLHFVQSIRL